jgi:hypothetical protein
MQTGQDNVKVSLRGARQPGLGGRRGLDLVSFCREEALKFLSVRFLIVDYEDATLLAHDDGTAVFYPSKLP